jgi:hypothetical protein
MADRRSRRDRYQVQLDYAFDRRLGSKLQQVYERLVPDKVPIAGKGSKMMENDNADRGNLCAGVVGQAAGGEHHRELDGGADRVCAEPRLPGAGGMGPRGRGL